MSVFKLSDIIFCEVLFSAVKTFLSTVGNVIEIWAIPLVKVFISYYILDHI